MSIDRSLLAVAVGLLAAALGLATCGRPEGPRVARLIPDEPLERLPAGGGESPLEETFHWRLDSPAAIAEWRLHQLAPQPGRAGILRAVSTGDDPQIVRQVELAATDVDVIEVAVDGLVEGDLRVFWAPPGGSFGEAASLTSPPSGDPLYRFAVGRHPAWRGRIGMIRLDPGSYPDAEIVFYGVRGLRTRDADAAVAAIAGRAWRIELGEEERPALVLPPGEALELRVDLPAQPVLELSWGVVAVADGRREAGPATLEITLAGEPPRRLVSLASPAGRAGWQRLRVALPPGGGDRLRLLGTTDAAGSAVAVAEPLIYDAAD